uniref:DOMON domain-containing protein n=1 Tax=Pygocentrus nattereri TaxID=42514 RepID=A0A3B4CKG4_PYGNA
RCAFVIVPQRLQLEALETPTGFRNGLVSSSCGDMTPSHSYTAQNSQEMPKNTDIKRKESKINLFCFSVTITANSTVFKGFLLEAREVGGSNPMGIFTLMGNNTQLLNSSVSHISDASKLQIQSKWKAPSSGNSKNIEFSAISNAGCGSNKTCFSDPSGCDPSSNSKCYFMSAAQSASGAPYKFEIVGGADGYVSIGFSDDKEMGNDDIYICGKDSNGNIQLQHAFSTGTTTPGNIALGNVSGFSSSLINGVISCSFTSGNPISTTRSSSSQSSCLMLIAWMTTGSIGMLIARYLKNAAKRTKFCGKDFWFGAHVFLMILSVAATIIAFILVFSYARDWSGGAHPVLGVIVMILSLAQPIAAMFPQGRHDFLFLISSIFTGLALVDSSEQQWLQKVMGGFVAWEAIWFLCQDFQQRRKKNGKSFGPELYSWINLDSRGFITLLT